MKISRFIAVAAAAVLSASIFCACGGGGTSTKAKQTTEAKAESKSPKLKPAGGKSSGNKAKGGTKSFQVEADYTFFGCVELETGTVLLAEDLDLSGTMKLEKGGTGSAYINGEGGNITWKLEDKYISIYEGDEIVYGGEYEDGVIYAVTPDSESVVFVYVQDGVDTSGWEAAATKQ